MRSVLALVGLLALVPAPAHAQEPPPPLVLQGRIEAIGQDGDTVTVTVRQERGTATPGPWLVVTLPASARDDRLWPGGCGRFTGTLTAATDALLVTPVLGLPYTAPAAHLQATASSWVAFSNRRTATGCDAPRPGTTPAERFDPSTMLP